MEMECQGYETTEKRRSDVAGEKAGGGLLFFKRQTEGLVFTDHMPQISDPTLAYVASERHWITVESSKGKTAICGTYLGFQAADDRHGAWNEGIYRVLREEIVALRRSKHRIVVMGDFNGHTGNVLGQGIPGNHAIINKNGERFLHFLETTSTSHINGACRLHNDWDSRLTSGLWTRQRGKSSTVIDYAVVSNEHMSSVRGMDMNDEGFYGGGGF